jgi:hypothetical protein
LEHMLLVPVMQKAEAGGSRFETSLGQKVQVCV